MPRKSHTIPSDEVERQTKSRGGKYNNGKSQKQFWANLAQKEILNLLQTELGYQYITDTVNTAIAQSYELNQALAKKVRQSVEEIETINEIPVMGGDVKLGLYWTEGKLNLEVLKKETKVEQVLEPVELFPGSGIWGQKHQEQQSTSFKQKELIVLNSDVE